MEIDRPLPNPMTPEAKPYWDGLRELMLPKCGACGHVFWYPRVACPRCHARSIGWIQSKGRGTLHAFEIGYQSFNKAFKVPTPYVLAMVGLPRDRACCRTSSTSRPIPGSSRATCRWR